jgi:hypothetical protein
MYPDAVYKIRCHTTTSARDRFSIKDYLHFQNKGMEKQIPK